MCKVNIKFCFDFIWETKNAKSYKSKKKQKKKQMRKDDL